MTKREGTVRSKSKGVRKTASRKEDIHTGRPTGREVSAMHRLQTLTEHYIGQGLLPSDARTRALEELRSNPQKDAR